MNNSKERKEERITPALAGLTELANDHGEDQEYKHRDDRNRNHPICSHPTMGQLVFITPRHPAKVVWENTVPTSHPPQSLHTPINIALALKERTLRMLNRLPLPMQIRQRVRANRLRFVGKGLARLQPLRAAVQTFCALEELLALF
jgi:hypothetical protein